MPTSGYNMSEQEAIAAYQTSFGYTAPGTVYYDPFNMKTQGQKLEFLNDEKYIETVTKGYNTILKNAPHLKAISSTTGGAGTAGYALIPVYLDPRIVDRSRKFTPMVNIVPRVANMGRTADYDVITAKGGAYTAAEDAALPETNDTYARASVVMKYLYAVGRVTGQSIAMIPAFSVDSMMENAGSLVNSGFTSASAPNATQLEVLVKTRALKELEEGLIINGNATTSVYGGADGTEFSGIDVLQSTTNGTNKSTTDLSLADIDTAITAAAYYGGMPNIAICDYGTYQDILGLLNDKIGYLKAQVETEWGFSAIKLNTMVGQVTVIPSRFLDKTTANKKIIFLDMSVIELRVLQDLTYEPLAKTNDSSKFMLKIYEALIHRAPTFCSSIYGIK